MAPLNTQMPSCTIIPDLQPTHMLSQPHSVSIKLWEQSDLLQALLDIRIQSGVQITVMLKNEEEEEKNIHEKH